MSLSLCSVCRVIFEGPLVLNEERPHHQTLDGFVQAAVTCYICRTITTSDMWKELERRAKLSNDAPPAMWYLASHTFHDTAADITPTWYKLTIDHDWGTRDEELYPPPNADSDDLADFYPYTPIWEFRIHASIGPSYSLEMSWYSVNNSLQKI